MTHKYVISQQALTEDQADEIKVFAAQNRWMLLNGKYFLEVTGEFYFFDYLKYKVGVDTEGFVCYKVGER